MDELNKLIAAMYAYAEETSGYPPALIRVTPEYRRRLMASVGYWVYWVRQPSETEMINGVPLEVVDTLDCDYEFIGVSK